MSRQRHDPHPCLDALQTRLTRQIHFEVRSRVRNSGRPRRRHSGSHHRPKRPTFVRGCGANRGAFEMRLLLAVCVVVGLGGSANAQKHLDTRGIGLTSCAEFGNLYRRHTDDLQGAALSWAQGYISGFNASRQDAVFDIGAKTIDEMWRFLRQYCNEHPLANYMDGVAEFMKSLPVVSRKK